MNFRSLSSIKALTFDVLGTVVDWRGSITREGRQLAKYKALKVRWPEFADDWTSGNLSSIERVRRGDLPWLNLDALHRIALEELLDKLGLGDFTESEKDFLNKVWHRLKPWPDSRRGLRQLRRRFVVSTLSNGNIALLTNMTKNAALTWDCVLSAELVRRYKPDKEVYQMAVDLLRVASYDILMVAAHEGDLEAAKEAGLRTAYIMRPSEFGTNRARNHSPDSSFDLIANDINDLARQLLH